MKKILITGGAGFVGRRFTRHFLEAGDEVHCVDKLAANTGGLDPDGGWPFFLPREYPNFHFYPEDCRDYFRRVDQAGSGQRDFDYVFHLAAMVGGRLMIEQMPLAVADDLSIDSHYWQWAEKARPKKTICFSSSASYPVRFQREAGYSLLREDMIDFGHDLGVPDFTYGWAKLTHEYLAKLAYEKHGLASVVYRPFSGYGPDQDDHYPFPSICQRALRQAGDPQVQVWGSGRQMRDFIHIDDCVRGVIATMDAISDGGALNLSTGRYTSFVDFMGQACEAVGYRPEVRGTSDKPEGVFARAGDTEKQAKYGFRATITLAQGIREALTYFRAREPLAALA
ncbi:MAG: NAD-dependent epimerase/dehydratase family protein [Cupriavidus sp.]|nr:MAG: NAD-dependent epimerase/dehydratase family protein [Cupriavidus sp.]